MVPRRAARRKTLPFLLLVLLPSAHLAGQTATDPLALEREIDAFVRREMAAAGIPGLALGIVSGSSVPYLKGFGVAGPDGEGVTPDTRFYLGSVSKTLTGLSVMQLVERGLVTLDDPVSRHLSWFWTDRITITHLLNHTSGITPYAGNDAGIERTEDLVERIRSKSRLGLAGDPGTRFRYSSLNYDILGAVVEAASGMEYGRSMDLSVFVPLEMRDTTADFDTAGAEIAAGYTPWFGLRLPYRIRYPRSAAPSGYIVSTARDMTHFLVAELNRGRYGDTALLGEAAMTATQISLGATGYAMGWF
ncbi:MAG: beta-lactamase family protein, partial [Burkholderiales bacterium]|nr:beta-lactamase family protein [Burkholderiales bacterium]